MPVIKDTPSGKVRRRGQAARGCGGTGDGARRRSVLSSQLRALTREDDETGLPCPYVGRPAVTGAR